MTMYDGRMGAETPASPRQATPGVSYHKRNTALAKAAARVCATGAGFGVAAGLMSPDDGVLHGQFLPVVLGAVIGGVIGLAWEIAINLAARVRTRTGTPLVAAGAVLIAMAAVGASSWAIATSLSGPSAVRQYLADAIVVQQRAFTVAAANARNEAEMADAADAAAAQARSQIALEREGRFSGARGDGPRTRFLAEAADGFARVASAMHDEAARVALLQAHGEKLLVTLQQDAAASPARFPGHVAELESVAAELEAIRLAPRARNAALIAVGEAAVDLPGRQMQQAVRAIADKLIARAADIGDGRKELEPAVFEPIQPHDAVLRYAASAAAGGWATAVCVDLLPLVLLGLIMSTSREELLHRVPGSAAPQIDPSDYDGGGDRSGSSTTQGPAPWRRSASRLASTPEQTSNVTESAD